MLKKIITPLVLSGISLAVISCASSKVILNEQYKMSSRKDPSMVIILKKDPYVNYSGNVEPEFGPGDPTTLIINFFKSQLIEDIKAQTAIKNIEFDTCATSGYYDHHEIEIKGSTESISVLSKGGKYNCRNSDPTYVLTLQDIYIGTALQTSYNAPLYGSNGMMMGGGSSTSKKLSYRAQVTLYDNSTQQPIEYGYIDESAQGFFPVITMNEWKAVSSTFVYKIFAMLTL